MTPVAHSPVPHSPLYCTICRRAGGLYVYATRYLIGEGGGPRSPRRTGYCDNHGPINAGDKYRLRSVENGALLYEPPKPEPVPQPQVEAEPPPPPLSLVERLAALVEEARALVTERDELQRMLDEATRPDADPALNAAIHADIHPIRPIAQEVQHEVQIHTIVDTVEVAPLTGGRHADERKLAKLALERTPEQQAAYDAIGNTGAIRVTPMLAAPKHDTPREVQRGAYTVTPPDHSYVNPKPLEIKLREAGTVIDPSTGRERFMMIAASPTERAVGLNMKTLPVSKDAVKRLRSLTVNERLRLVDTIDAVNSKSRPVQVKSIGDDVIGVRMNSRYKFYLRTGPSGTLTELLDIVPVSDTHHRFSDRA